MTNSIIITSFTILAFLLAPNNAFRCNIKHLHLLSNAKIHVYRNSDRSAILNRIDSYVKTFRVTATAAATVLAIMLNPHEVLALSPSSEHPIVVLGSNGKTGKQIVSLLAKSGVAVRPTLRDAVKGASLFKDLGDSALPVVAADVTKADTLDPAIRDASAVIFAASASSKGGNAQQVDYLGVKTVAEECIKMKVPRLVVISSGAITRPDSLGFKITNLFGNIMNYKLDGENALKATYAQFGDASLSYAIIRPGGLLDNNAVGPSKIELNQGDTISGEVNRADVAECAAAAATSTKLPPNVIFEVYEQGKSGPLEGRFATKSGYEQNGKSSYDELFQGLKSGDIKI